MRGPSWMVITTTFVLELIAFGLAVGAMTRRSTASVTTDLINEYCSYTSDIATGLATGAVLFLFFGQVVIMGATGCFCCGGGAGRGKARACALLSFYLSWFCFLVAELCLVVGAALNKVHTSTRIAFLDESSLTCKEVRKSVFAAGAAFTFLTLFFGEIYYFSLVKASQGSSETYKSGTPTINMTSYP